MEECFDVFLKEFGVYAYRDAKRSVPRSELAQAIDTLRRDNADVTLGPNMDPGASGNYLLGDCSYIVIIPAIGPDADLIF